MKKSLIALASVAALGAAHADVTLYGVIDVGVGTSSSNMSSDVNNPSNANVYPSCGNACLLNSTAGRVTSPVNGLLTPSRWGVKGTENLGGGLTGMFTLESALNPWGGNNPNDHALLAGNTAQTGAGDSSLNGQMFDREASVGVKGDLGQITVGFQLNLNGERWGAADPLGGGYISPFGTYGGLSGMGSSFTGRASNSFKYAYTMGNTQLKAFYAMGGESGNAGAGSQTGVQVLMQATPALSLGLTAARMNDNVAFASGANTVNNQGVPGLAATYYNSTETILDAQYQANPKLKFYGGYLQVVQSNPSNGAADALITANLGIPISAASLNTSPYTTNLTTTVGWLGLNYDVEANQHAKFGFYNKTVSAYTKGYASASTLQANTVAGDSFTYAQGNTPIFAFAYTYDLSKKTDIYFAANWEKYDTAGQAALACTATSNLTANQPAQCSATNNGAGPLSQWANMAGLSVSYFGVGYRTRF
jgi:predicted porin